MMNMSCVERFRKPRRRRQKSRHNITFYRVRLEDRERKLRDTINANLALREHVRRLEMKHDN